MSVLDLLLKRLEIRETFVHKALLVFLFKSDDSIEQSAFELQQRWIRPPTELFLLDKLKGRLEESLGVTGGLLKRDHLLNVVASSHHEFVHWFRLGVPGTARIDFTL